jgi:RNA polymerase sigma-70 factor (ECF subfamily)
VKHYDRDRRAVDLERSLDSDLDRSASGMAGRLAADQTSPSQEVVRDEELLRLADALAALPEPMREVVVLQHLRGWTLKDIAERLGRPCQPSRRCSGGVSKSGGLPSPRYSGERGWG